MGLVSSLDTRLSALLHQLEHLTDAVFPVLLETRSVFGSLGLVVRTISFQFGLGALRSLPRVRFVSAVSLAPLSFVFIVRINLVGQISLREEGEIRSPDVTNFLTSEFENIGVIEQFVASSLDIILGLCGLGFLIKSDERQSGEDGRFSSSSVAGILESTLVLFAQHSPMDGTIVSPDDLVHLGVPLKFEVVSGSEDMVNVSEKSKHSLQKDVMKHVDRFIQMVGSDSLSERVRDERHRTRDQAERSNVHGNVSVRSRSGTDDNNEGDLPSGQVGVEVADDMEWNDQDSNIPEESIKEVEFRSESMRGNVMVFMEVLVHSHGVLHNMYEPENEISHDGDSEELKSNESEVVLEIEKISPVSWVGLQFLSPKSHDPITSGQSREELSP